MKGMRRIGAAVLTAAFLCAAPATARAESAKELNRDAAAALKELYRTNDTARALGKKAKAVLVFPKIVKAGFLFGGALGEGVLLRNGKPSGYYKSIAGSYGLQAGVQWFGYDLASTIPVSSSTSKSSVALGGITPPAPRAP